MSFGVGIPPTTRMKKNFSANLLFLIALNLLIKPIYLFGIEVGIQNTVGTSDYGLYYAMFNFTFLFNVLLDMGINNYQKIKVAENTQLGLGNMATLLPLKLVLGVVYMLVTVVVALIIGFETRYWYFIAWLMLSHVLSAFLLLLRANLSGMQLFFRDSIVSVIDRLVLVIGIGYILWFGTETFKIEWFVIFQVVAYTIGILFALVLTPAKNRFPTMNFSISNGWAMIQNTWPYALLILLMTAYNKLDGIMLERLAIDGLKEAGIYAQAYRIIDAGNSFAFLYAGMLLPIFAKLLAQKNVTQLKVMIDQGARYLILPAALAVVVVFFHSQSFMALLYNQEVAESSIAFRWLMGSFLFICMAYVYGTLITAASELSALNWIAFSAVLVNFGLNFWLIPILGAEGAAIASFCSLFIMSVAQILFVSRITGGHDFRWLVRTILAIIILIGACYLISESELSDLMKLLLSSAAAIVLLAILGFRKQDLKTMLPQDE